MIIATLVIAAAAVAAASADKPFYLPPPDWVESAQIPLETLQSGSSTDVLLESIQARYTAQSDDIFVECAIRINTAAGLSQAGSLDQLWNPLTDKLTIHKAVILRGGKSIDLLANKTFTVLRRETNLEAAMIDGQLTATLEPEGLQVGDTVDMAATLSRHEPAMAGHSESAFATAHLGRIARLSIRAVWPASTAMRQWRTDDLSPPVVSTRAGWTEARLDLKDAVSPEPPTGAPLRDQLLSALQFSDFQSWSSLSKTIDPLYKDATILDQDSPIKTEIASIRAANTTAPGRVLAALQLVENQTRYLYVGLDAGGYKPAHADLTWKRRFGDCKGKTVLLLALLRGLDVPAEAVLVNTQSGDGLERRLPAMGDFDHVLVRAEVEGRDVWLDATRIGDASLSALRTPNVRWGLPLRENGADLEAVSPDAPALPQVDKRLTADLRQGWDKSSPVHMEITFRGDAALVIDLAMKRLGSSDGDRALRKLFENDESWIRADKVGYTYDPQLELAKAELDGSGVAPFVKADDGQDWRLDESSLGWEADFHRNSDYHRNAPYAVTYPSYTRWTVTIRLPHQAKGFEIYNGGKVAKTIGAVAYTRGVGIAGDQFTMSASANALSPEFPAIEAIAAQSALRELSNHNVVLHMGTTTPIPASPTTSDTAPSPVPKLADDETFERRASAEFLSSDFTDAIDDFTRAIKDQPGKAKLYYDRGAANLRLGRTEQGRADFAAALRLDPDDAFVLFGLGTLDLSDGKAALAAKYFESAERKAEDAQAMRERIATAYEQQDDLAEAAAYHDRWLSQPSPSPKLRSHVLNQACWSRARSGRDLKVASAQCDEALVLDPHNGATLDTRGLVRFRLGDYAGAEADYNESLALGAKATSFFGRGLIEEKRGEAKKAAADLAAARKHDPEIDAQVSKWGLKP